MRELTAREAASMLGVSSRRVNALIAANQLDARQLSSGLWLIESDSIHRYERIRSAPGRLLSVNAAWAILFELSGIHVDWLPARTYASVRTRIRDVGAMALSIDVAHRTRARRFYFDAIRPTGLIATGISAARIIGSDLVEDRRWFSGYVPHGTTVNKFADEHMLIAGGDGPDVLYENTAPVPMTEPMPGVVAADLAVSLDPREQEAGVNTLVQLRQTWIAKQPKR